MSSPNCCFLTYIQVSQEAGQVVWYSHFFQNFPQFIVVHTVKGFGVVNEAEVDVFLELSFFFMIQQMLAIWSLVSLPFLNPAWTSGISRFRYCWSLGAQRLMSCGSWALERRVTSGGGLSYSEVRGIFLGQVLYLCLQHWQVGSYPLCHQGSPALCFKKWICDQIWKWWYL